ncbi:MAG: phage tail tape measure protein [Candidatus Norongarragalinales archaeon]
MAKGRRELAELNAKQRELNREFSAAKLPKDSLVALRLEYSKLTKQVAELSKAERESEFGQKLIKDAARIKKEIDGVEQSMGRFTGNVGNYKSALSGLGNVMAAIGIGFSVGEIVNQNALLSDAVANVAKTTGLAVSEADKVRQALEKIDTRTSVLNLLKIAEIGGQLGIAGKDIETFTIAVDKLNVALGDAFGGNVEELTRVIAGIRNSLADFRTDDAADDMLRLGNALNFLESQGSATAPVISDFVSRISGIAGPLGVSTEQIFGLSTALAELNVSPERGATAVSRLLQEIAKAPEAFAKSLGFSGKQLDEFIQTANTDLVGALAMVSKALAEGGDGTKNFAQTLDEIGIGQAGAIEVLGKLGQGTELLTKRIEQSSVALQGTDSLLEEFDKKNNNAAAAVDKLQKAFLNLITGEGAQTAIQVVAEALADLLKTLESTLNLVFDNAEEFGTLTGVMFAFSKPGQIASETLRSIAISSQTATAATVRQTIATQASTVATRALAAAQAALPLLAVVAGIYAVVKAFEVYNENLSATAKATKAVEEAQKSIAESSAAEIAAVERSIGVLQSATTTQRERAKAIQELTSKYPDYLEGINLEIQSAEALTKIQRELTEEIIRSAAARAKARAQEEITAKIVEQRLKIAEEEKKAAEGRRTVFVTNEQIIEREREKLAELEEQLEQTGKKFDEAFNLDKPRKSSVIEIVDPKSLKQQEAQAVEQVKSIALSISKEEKTAQDKAIAERRKREEEELRRQEAQAKRLIEIQRNVRSLSISEEGKYQQQIAELEERRIRALEENQQRIVTLRKSIEERTGRRINVQTTEEIRKLPDAKPADITEADLIDKENEAIKQAFERQRQLIEQERKASLERREQVLRTQLLEVAKIEAETESKSADIALSELQSSFDKRRKVIEQEAEQRKRDLRTLEVKGEISEQERAQKEIEVNIEVNTRKLLLEREYAQRTSEIVEQLKQVRIAAAKAELEVQLEAIKQREQADIAAAQQEQTDLGVDNADKIAAIRARAAAEAIAAEQTFAQAVKEATAQSEQVQLDAIASINAAQQAAHEAELARIEEQKARRQELRDLALDVAGDLSSKLFEINRNNLQVETEERIKAIEVEFEAKKKRAGQNQKAIERLEAEQAKRKEEIERQAAEKRKQIAIIEAIINTAIAVARVAYNPILAAATAALGAVQIAVIKSQRFAKGGKVGKRDDDNTGIYTVSEWQAMPDVSEGGYTRPAGRIDDTGHRIAGKLSRRNAVVHEGEYVAPAWMVKQMPALFERLERIRISRSASSFSDLVTSRAQTLSRRTYIDAKIANFKHVFAGSFQQGGFATQAPVVISQPVQPQSQVVEVSAMAAFDEEQVRLLAERIANEAAIALRRSLAEGLNDANRRLEREAALEQRRTV